MSSWEYGSPSRPTRWPPWQSTFVAIFFFFSYPSLPAVEQAARRLRPFLPAEIHLGTATVAAVPRRREREARTASTFPAGAKWRCAAGSVGSPEAAARAPHAHDVPASEREERLSPSPGAVATTLIAAERGRVADVTLGRRSRTNRAQGAASPGAAALRAPARAPAPSRGCARLPGASGRGRLPARAAAPGQRRSSAGREVSAGRGAGGAAVGGGWGGESSGAASLTRGRPTPSPASVRGRRFARRCGPGVPLLCGAGGRGAARRFGTGRPRSRASLNFTGGLGPRSWAGPARSRLRRRPPVPAALRRGAAPRSARFASRPSPRSPRPVWLSARGGPRLAGRGAERPPREGCGRGGAARSNGASAELRAAAAGTWPLVRRRGVSGQRGAGRAGSGGARNLRRRLLCALCSSRRAPGGRGPGRALEIYPFVYVTISSIFPALQTTSLSPSWANWYSRVSSSFVGGISGNPESPFGSDSKFRKRYGDGRWRHVKFKGIFSESERSEERRPVAPGAGGAVLAAL